MLNRIILIGRLVADPNLRYTQSGIAVTTFTLAVNRQFGDNEADFIDIVVWRKQAEICANHLAKGRLVAVEGRLQIRSYDDQNGIRRKASEVIADNVRFLDRSSDSGGQQNESSHGQTAFEPEPDFDDVPF